MIRRMRIVFAILVFLSACAEHTGEVAYEAGDTLLMHADALAYCNAAGGAPFRIEDGLDVDAVMNACREAIDDSQVGNKWGADCWIGEAFELPGYEGQIRAYTIGYNGHIHPTPVDDPLELAYPLCVVLR